MDLTAAEVAAIRFSGTRYVYNRREVDAFVRRVSTTLRNHERELARIATRMAALEHALDVAHAARTSRAKASSERRRALDQAIRVAGAPRPPGSGPTGWEGLDTGAWEAWRETMEAEYAAADELDMAHEDSRRLRGCAAALAAEIEATAGLEAAGLVADAKDAVTETSQDRSEASPPAADDAASEASAEAELAAAEILSAAELEVVRATEEAASMLEAAEIAAHRLTAAAEREADALTLRLAQLRTAVRQAEAYYREVAPESADRAALAGDLIDLDLTGLLGIDESDLVEGSESEADLTKSAPDLAEATDPSEAGDRNGDDASADGPREPDFYRRRLAGLRERLEHTILSD